jgi:hypothetical protein
MFSLVERPLSEWIEWNLLIDDIKSALLILDRTKAKCLKGGSPEVVESPLTGLSFIEKAMKRSSRISETGSFRLSRKANRSKAKAPAPVKPVEKPEPKVKFGKGDPFGMAGPGSLGFGPGGLNIKIKT